ncbi:glycosyltransferase family 4 protein [Candidatus Shapirobacteria bacterium CG10_big_fil_rev_8_21_14_0_10_38_14]|uniref:Glycosyltransferase family 4 protein n=1 Tax=Candidatus Shapirobacteria bacterium CG10_big_fil_rev_8_21_14_0_10_38_14 TaxID=1974483 RepID=A0A2M8L6F5_9BACT|nr:MAG: glycosyltransferase family 4 protein [Candidatus Shapirobacteria bacterium CG10_big_fil_rev_8_21_14_0_10_38_14]
MRVALVYDWVVKWGGAERVLLALHKIWPEASLFTAVYNTQSAFWAKEFKIIPSFLNKFPLAKIHHEFYAPLMPLALESFNFDNYDLVISVTSAMAKGIITKPETRHICYCLTPTRFLWSGYKDYFDGRILRRLTPPAVAYLRCWDKIAAQRPDTFVAISKNVQKRIKKYYHRDAAVIYPPLDTKTFVIGDTEDVIRKNYFLVVSRLVKYKKTDLAIRAFNRLKLPLKIVGVGREMNKLKKIANKNIEFLGQLTDNQLLSYYQKCRAVIFPQEEDFGLVPLEAQSCGRPIVACKAGGALETVIENKTGLFFEKQNEEELIAAIKKFEKLKFDPKDCRQNALRFNQKEFEKKWSKII